MKISTNNPMAVVVRTEIDIHTAINAIMEFSMKYPVERLSIGQAHQLMKAADNIHYRIRTEVPKT